MVKPQINVEKNETVSKEFLIVRWTTLMRKKLWSMSIFLLLLGSALKVNITGVSAVPTSPYIMVVPEKTVDPNLTPGLKYTVSIYTDYDGSDVWGWQFSLTYDPDVLHGGDINTTDTWQGDGSTKIFNATRTPIVTNSEKVYVNQTLMTKPANYTIDYSAGKITFTIAPSPGVEVKAIYLGSAVVNGDLITTEKSSRAKFNVGKFDNTLGTLSLTLAWFRYVNDWNSSTIDTDVTKGPGTLAYVTFTVVGTGISSITLGEKTFLKGCDITTDPPTFYNIIDATMPNHIGQGYFCNIPNVHDVAVSNLDTPTTAILGDLVAINVTVRNEGNFTENFDVTVYANTTLIGTQTANLTRGAKATLTFNWNTTELVEGNYKINATAWLAEDIYLSDNSKTTQIETKSVHDVAIINLKIPAQAIVGDLVAINMTVKNEGTFEENVTLTISYLPIIPYPPPPTVINTTNFTLAKRPTSKIIQVNWNTTGLEVHTYTINATVTIDKDEDLSDNTLLELTTLKLGLDVAVTAVSAAPPKVFVGETETISVTIQNVGGFNATLFEVKVTYDTKDIGSQQVPSLPIGNSTTLSFTWNTAGVEPEIYQIRAEAILETDANPTNNRKMTLVVVAAPIGQIAGIVRDASTGNPIEGATVTAGAYTNTTNADGHYQLSNVLAGNYTVAASKNGYQTSSQTSIRVVAGKTTNLNFTLTPLPTTGHITGTVTDASTGNPIEGAQVTAGGHTVSTNATGGYSIELAAETYNVTVSAEGYESSSKTDVNVVAGATTTVDFELTPIQRSNIFLYAAAVVGVITVIAGTAVYLRKGKKTT